MNLLPLDIWREQIGYHPYHFWGMKDDDKLKVDSKCNVILPEYSWQRADMISRTEIRRSIEIAEQRLREHLQYSIGRRWITETLQFPRPGQSGQQYTGQIDADGRWLNVRLSEGFVRAVGVETRTEIEADVSITFSDADGDGINETFTLTVNTAVTDPDEIEVYFNSTDRRGEAASEKHRIKPVSITISEGEATITGKSWLLVKPIKYEGFGVLSGLDPADALADSLDVYRHYTDVTGTTNDTYQALLVWESSPPPSWASTVSSTVDFGSSANDPAAVAYATARINVRDARLGYVGVGASNYNATSGVWGIGSYAANQPDRVIIRYEAGVPLGALESTDGLSRLNGRWEEIVVRLACAELKRRELGCHTALQELSRWQWEMARSGGGEGEFRLSEQALNNPLGTAQGAVYAWNQVKNLGLVRSISV